MATIREHAAQHDAISDLPLVTETATVTDVTVLDRDRRDDVRAAVVRRLADRELGDAYEVGSDAEAWHRLRDALAADGHAALARRVAALADRFERPRPMLVSVTLRTGREFRYLPGQYVGLRYDGTSRAYSLASSPTRNEIEICVRRVPSGRLSPRLCEDVEVGDTVTVRGPHGDLVPRDPSTRDAVFLATGTGVAPFKGMIDHMFETGGDTHRGEQRDVWLFLGAAWADDLPYRESFEALAAERENFHFVPCLSRESYVGNWDGETDYVQHALLKHVDEAAVAEPVGRHVDQWLRRPPATGLRTTIDPSDVDVYACGINAMVYGLVAAAERVGVPAERIRCEGFG